MYVGNEQWHLSKAKNVCVFEYDVFINYECMLRKIWPKLAINGTLIVFPDYFSLNTKNIFPDYISHISTFQKKCMTLKSDDE